MYFTGARCVEVNKDDRHIISDKGYRIAGSVYFSNVQIVHTFAERVIPNLDFKVTIFFNVKCLENGLEVELYLQ